jgi:hypothetical protein
MIYICVYFGSHSTPLHQNWRCHSCSFKIGTSFQLIFTLWINFMLLSNSAACRRYAVVSFLRLSLPRCPFCGFFRVCKMSSNNVERKKYKWISEFHSATKSGTLFSFALWFFKKTEINSLIFSFHHLSTFHIPLIEFILFFLWLFF